MNKTVLTATLAVLLSAGTALANPATNTGNGGAAATTNGVASGSYSNSHTSAHQRQVFDPTINLTVPPSAAATPAAAPVVNTTVVSPVTPASSGSGGSAASSHSYRQPGFVEAHQAPDVMPPGIVNYNGCSGSGKSLGASGPGASLAFAWGGGFDEVCQAEAYAHRQDLAFAILCQKDKEVQKASMYTDRPCPQVLKREDEQDARHGGFFSHLFSGGEAQAQPVRYPTNAKPGWCYAIDNTSGGRIELRNHPECR